MTATIDGAGLWCGDVTSGFVARAANAGFDWLCLDLQHGRILDRDCFDIIRTLPAGAPTVAIRVASSEAAGIGSALDSGAAVVIVPSVSSAEEAARAVAAAFYPPIGGRSWGQYAGFGGGAPRPAADLNDLTMCAVMIETLGGYRDVEAIAAVPGVGMLFVGPYDLSLSLGTSVSALLEDGKALTRIADTARAHGVSIGAFAGTPAAAHRFRELGYDCIVIADDSFVIAAGAEAALKAFRTPAKGQPAQPI